RAGSDLAGRAQERLRAVGALSPDPPPAATPPAPAPVATPSPLPPPSYLPPPPPRTMAPPPPKRRHWGRIVLAVLAVLLLVGGGGAAAAILLTRGSSAGDSTTQSTSATPAALVVGNDLTVTMDKTQTGDCITDYIFTAGGSLSGSGQLVYHWEQSDGYKSADTPIEITNQVGLAIQQHWRITGHRTGNATMTFVVTAPQERTASKTFDTTCP
ncbi:MAG TPA: hypothetical protein VI316_07575, partial [Candidatus Dormibacteraeota bacterium]